jgi:hypothetical protein
MVMLRHAALLSVDAVDLEDIVVRAAQVRVALQLHQLRITMRLREVFRNRFLKCDEKVKMVIGGVEWKIWKI